MAENLKHKFKNLPKKEKFFGILSYVTSEDITEKTKLCDVVKDVANDADREKPIMACSLYNDLGLDSLDVYELCFQCKDVFDIDEEIDVEMSTVTVQQLYDIVKEHGKGD
jgi:acyl carrier protein